MMSAGMRRAGVVGMIVVSFAGTCGGPGVRPGPAADRAGPPGRGPRPGPVAGAANATRAAERAMADFRWQRDQLRAAGGGRPAAGGRPRRRGRPARTGRRRRQPNVDKLAGAAAEQKGLEAAARQAWDAANSAANAAKADAVARFEASAAWQAANAQALEADRDLQAKTEAAIARLTATPAYQSAAKEVERLREVRDRLRDRGPDTAGLPQASEAWYTANGKVATARVNAADADPAVQAARKAAADAKREVVAMRTAFEQGLPADPAVAPALAEAAANMQEPRRRDDGDDVRDVRGRVGEAAAGGRRAADPRGPRDARKAADDLTRFARDRETLAARENAANREIDRLRFDERRTAQDRDRALQSLQQAMANEERARQADNSIRRPK